MICTLPGVQIIRGTMFDLHRLKSVDHHRPIHFESSPSRAITCSIGIASSRKDGATILVTVPHYLSSKTESGEVEKMPTFFCPVGESESNLLERMLLTQQLHGLRLLFPIGKESAWLLVEVTLQSMHLNQGVVKNF